MTDGTGFTERELDIMSILWARGSGTVAEVRAELQEDLGYTSVLKMLQILEEKGSLRHELEGRAYRYFPLVEPEQAGGKALRRIVDKIFHGSAEMALARLVSDRSLGPEQVERMKAMLDELVDEGEEDGGDGGRGMAEEDEE
ncbi:MAG: BlaI/MecI/CopY family transcriptional regulator [Longimicrobiales bacterium]|nr:BlaI/MecI/CopY family transcriptional regulator [Longimicrobiales bacterium]